MKSKRKFSKLDFIGTADAENDHLLNNCFIDSGYYDVLVNHKDPRNIILGRTGSGKSALIKKINNEEERVININPEDLSLAYITNSTILQYLLSINVRFDLFFKLLWRHVISIEIIKKHFHLNSEESKDRWLFQFLETKKKRNKEALQYLENWGERFWEETDFRIREITDRFTGKIEADLKCSVAELKAEAEKSEEIKSEITQRAQRVVDQIQVSELSNMIDLIDDVLDDDQKKYFITIDKLDENWIEDSLRYLMIKALIESSKEFKKVKNLKVIISLREDLLNRVYSKTRDAGFQKEKYESLCIHITWNKRDLIQLLNLRISELFKSKGINEEISITQLLPSTINRYEKPIDYIIERTLMRPRDAIQFLNSMIRRSDNKNQFTAQIIRDAEAEYSESRFNAISDEWFTDYPNFSKTAGLLYDRKRNFKITDITIDDCDDFCLEILSLEIPESYKIGKIFKLANLYCESKISYEKYRNDYILIFFEIGLIGLKLHNRERALFFIDEFRDIRNPTIDDKTRIEVHKAFWRKLNIQESA